jgi:hypothetical protein
MYNNYISRERWLNGKYEMYDAHTIKAVIKGYKFSIKANLMHMMHLDFSDSRYQAMNQEIKKWEQEIQELKLMLK